MWNVNALSILQYAAPLEIYYWQNCHQNWYWQFLILRAKQWLKYHTCSVCIKVLYILDKYYRNILRLCVTEFYWKQNVSLVFSNRKWSSNYTTITSSPYIFHDMMMRNRKWNLNWHWKKSEMKFDELHLLQLIYALQRTSMGHWQIECHVIVHSMMNFIFKFT